MVPFHRTSSYVRPHYRRKVAVTHISITACLLNVIEQDILPLIRAGAAYDILDRISGIEHSKQHSAELNG